jgi:hypothetical protein
MQSLTAPNRPILASVENPPRPSLRIRLPIKSFTFHTIYYLVFLFSGVLTIATILWSPVEYRMGLVSALVLPLIALYGIRLTPVTLTYVALTIAVLISAILNNSPIGDVIEFSRILIFSYLMYRLVDIYIRPHNIVRIIRTCVWIGCIQMPFILLERATYDLMPGAVQRRIHRIDFDFGTFNFAGDASMCYFLILIIIFLLFDSQRNHIIQRRYLILAWLSATVLVTNSEMSKVILIFVWGVYLLRYLNRKRTIALLFVLAVTLGVLWATGYLATIYKNLQVTAFHTVEQIEQPERSIQLYLRGGYGRGGAIRYYLSRPILWFGDGPSRYSDPIARVRLRGNVGHIFTFYSEVGFVGWMLSTAVFALIAFDPRRGRIRNSLIPLMMFITVQMLSFTNAIMNNISVMLIYCIMAKWYMVPIPTLVSIPPPSAQVDNARADEPTDSSPTQVTPVPAE